MKRCRVCGWWFDPADNRQLICDEECRKESMRIARRDYNRRIRKKSKPPKAVLKCNPAKLPNPPLPPTRSVRIDDPEDYEVSKEHSIAEFFEVEQNNTTGPFTAEEDALISSLFAEGKTVNYIAKKLHRYAGAVNGRIKLLKLKEEA